MYVVIRTPEPGTMDAMQWVVRCETFAQAEDVAAEMAVEEGGTWEVFGSTLAGPSLPKGNFKIPNLDHFPTRVWR